MLSRYDPFDVQSDIIAPRTSLTRWNDPFDPQSNILGPSSFDRAFKNLSNQMMQPFVGARDPLALSLMEPAMHPLTDIQETNNSFIYTLDVPNYNKDNIKVSIRDDRLEVEGQIEKEVREDSDPLDFVEWHRRERYFKSFKRAYLLPENIKNENPKVKLANGVLSITLHKKKKSEKKKVLAISD